MLFGHLASRFSPSSENIATEALAYILRSELMREALGRLVGRTDIELPRLARFRSQTGDEQGNIPDLIGFDTTGAERLLVENKFWAGLTNNQPAGYLDRLPAEGGGVLVFVVPDKRLSTIWTELVSSAMSRGRQLPDHPERIGDDLLFARLSASTGLAVTTWAAVLNSLDAATRAAGEMDSAADIAQLKSLCDTMDNEAFLPVRREELTNLEVPRRLIGLAELIQDLTGRAVNQKIVDVTGLRPGHGWHGTGRYLKIGPAGAWLGIEHRHWSRYGITPLWILFGPSPSFGKAALVLEALKDWAQPRLFEEDGSAVIPLTVLPDVERERVLENLLEQLRHLRDALPSGAGPEAPPPVDPNDENP